MECDKPLTERHFDSLRAHLVDHVKKENCLGVNCPVCSKLFPAKLYKWKNFSKHLKDHARVGDYTDVVVDTVQGAPAPSNEVVDEELNDDVNAGNAGNDEVIDEVIDEVNDEVNAGNDEHIWSDDDDTDEVTGSSDQEESSEDEEQEDAEQEDAYEQGQPSTPQPQPPPPPPPPPHSLAEGEKIFRDSQADFFLQLAAKFSLSGEAMNTIARYLMASRAEVAQLIVKAFQDSRCQPSNPEAERQLCEDFLKQYQALEPLIGMEAKLSSTYRRQEFFKRNYDIVFPTEVQVGREGEETFYAYTTPMSNTLGQFFRDHSLRPYLFVRVNHPARQHDPGVHASFTDGKVFKDLTSEVQEEYVILVRLYSDGVSMHNPLGAAKDKDKITAMYYSPIQDTRVGSRRSSCQAITLVDTNVIDKVGLDATFSHAIEDIAYLERHGFVDPVTGLRLPVFVIAGVGDNLQQNENVGMAKNFSGMANSCRKCELKLIVLRTAESYYEIHAKYQKSRTRDSLAENYQRKRDKYGDLPNKNWKGVATLNIYRKLRMDSAVTMAQCLSHDLFEGAIKVSLTFNLMQVIS